MSAGDRRSREELEEAARRAPRDDPDENDPRPRAPEAPVVTGAAREATVDRVPERAEREGGEPLREDAAGDAFRAPVRLGSRGTLRERRRHAAGVAFQAVAAAATFVGVVALAVLLADVLIDGLPVLDVQFLTSFASRFAERAGIKAAAVGSLWILALTALISFPLSVGAAIYLEEYAGGGWVTKAIQTNIANLAGVPSIVYGILGLAVFVRALAFERSVLSGALTLSLLILPVIIMASQEAIRAVPDSLRQAAYGLGATRLQVVRTQVLPMALPGILTGTILALSRAVGETAPLILVGAVGFIAFTPTGLGDPFTVLPIQIFNWVSRPQPEFHALAAAGILVLLAILLTMNSVAILMRNRFQRRR